MIASLFMICLCTLLSHATHTMLINTRMLVTKKNASNTHKNASTTVAFTCLPHRFCPPPPSPPPAKTLLARSVTLAATWWTWAALGMHPALTPRVRRARRRPRAPAPPAWTSMGTEPPGSDAAVAHRWVRCMSLLYSPPTHTYARAPTHPLTHTCTHTHPPTHSHVCTYSHPPTHSHMCTCTHPLTRMRVHPPTYPLTRMHVHPPTHTYALARTHSLTHMHAHPPTHSHACTCTHSLTRVCGPAFLWLANVRTCQLMRHACCSCISSLLQRALPAPAPAPPCSWHAPPTPPTTHLTARHTGHGPTARHGTASARSMVQSAAQRLSKQARHPFPGRMGGREEALSLTRTHTEEQASTHPLRIKQACTQASTYPLGIKQARTTQASKHPPRRGGGRIRHGIMSSIA